MHSNLCVEQVNFEFKGFSKYHFTPMEVLAIIQHVEKCTGRNLSTEDIESGVLKDLLIKEDYDIVKVVSTYIFLRN